ncbi:MAG: hypothetical protein PHO32_00525 [Candidatus Cloacimonetes bacterium]|nr:hypothetical protein [Candidatus Cloacimonadota bacterium]
MCEDSNEHEKCSFTIEGKYVCIDYKGHQHKLKRSIGLNHLLELISNPGLPISIMQLDCGWASPAPRYHQFKDTNQLRDMDLHLQRGFLSQPLADMQTINEVKERLNDIISQLAELEENCDYAARDDLCEERDSLADYLKQVYSPNGKARNFQNEGYRQRKRVKRAINRAMEQIATLEPDLATELAACLKLRDVWIYQPDRINIVIRRF